MTWSGIEGHDDVVERFRRALRAGRLASTFLFVGPAGIGKRTFALKLAQGLLCESHGEEELDPCGVCPACQQVDALSHPDLQLVCKPPDKSFVPIELFIGDREHRMREGLCHNIALKPFRGGRKVAVIDDADFLNAEGANCLLKTLEEPPPRSVLILIGTSEQKQLPTIRSRSQVIRFQALPEETVASLLVAQGLVADPAQARRLAALSGGSLTVAADLAEEQLGEFRQTLLRELAQPNGSAQDFPRSVIEFVEDAGKENAPRRARMVQVVGFAAEFYRQLMRSLSGAGVSGDEPLRGAVQSAHRSWAGDAETAAACLDRCVDAFGHIQANASPSALLESWLDELATITRRGRPL